MMVRGETGGNSDFGHAYSLNGAMAVQDGVHAGCDSNCGDPYRQYMKSVLLTSAVLVDAYDGVGSDALLTREALTGTTHAIAIGLGADHASCHRIDDVTGSVRTPLQAGWWMRSN
jgi:hypothetical protein